MERDYLLKHRKEHHKTMVMMADELGITRNYYEALEKGKKGDKLTLETADKIAKVIMMTLDDLLILENIYKASRKK